MNEKLITEITLYTLKLSDQTITAEEFKTLNSILSSNSQAARYYNHLMMTLYNFKERGKDIICDEKSIDSILNETLWKELADYEKTAKEVKIHHESPRHELIQKVVYPPREKRKLSRLSIFTLLNVAAVLFLFLILRFAPPKGIEVATLTDSLGATWVNAKGPMQDGTRLHLSKTPLFLSEGLAMLTFDNKASVVIEGPAEFTLLAEDRIGLNYGKVFANIPEQAVGFSVYTNNAKIIDLGTEFGVDVNTYGDTRLHVIQGKTALIVGERTNRVSVEVEAGVAKKVMADSLTVSDISYSAERERYVRHFDSRSGTVWRGQPALCLADIVGGGDGFGTGMVDTGIDPTTGKPAQMLLETRVSTNDFQPVSSNPYIDGVFIPDGRKPQIISSLGHVFQECPPTSGDCFNNVLNAVRIIDLDTAQNSTAMGSPKAVNCLLLHANMGITYDLQALRGRLPGATIARFQSMFGIEREALYPALSNADFWVLVDGELRHKQTQVGWGEPFNVNLPLSSKNRFLTLVVTDGGDPQERIYNDAVFPPIHSDWGMFADPILILDSD